MASLALAKAKQSSGPQGVRRVAAGGTSCSGQRGRLGRGADEGLVLPRAADGSGVGDRWTVAAAGRAVPEATVGVSGAPGPAECAWHATTTRARAVQRARLCGRSTGVYMRVFVERMRRHGYDVRGRLSHGSVMAKVGAISFERGWGPSTRLPS